MWEPGSFEVFFVCAQVLVKHDLLLEFSKTKPQLNEKHEETWWSSILKWLTSTPALVFLKLGMGLHATWERFSSPLCLSKSCRLLRLTPLFTQPLIC